MDEGRLYGLYAGVITYRNDPERRARVKVRVPGILEPAAAQDGPWALPKGAGDAQWGRNSVPPLGAAVYVQFLGGDPAQPVWEPGWHGIPVRGGVAVPESFPEHEHPDVHVFGLGPFRLVIDLRPGQEVLTLKMVKTLGNIETSVGHLLMTAAGNSVQLRADAIAELSAGALVNVDAPVVQVHERKVVPNGRAID